MDREAIARIIGSFVVYDDHGGPDTEVLADRIAATHDAAYDALMGLADQILALTPPPGAGGIAEAAAQLAGLQLGWKLGLRGDDDEYRLTFERWSAEIAEAKRSVALLASPSPKAEDEAYEIGKRDGYESAIQDVDLATGGDGEYYASNIPGRGCPDPQAMLARIVERFKASPQEAEGWKLVPVEPTVAMVRAAINLEVAPDEPITDYLHTPGNSDEDRKIWEAVVPGIVSEAVFFHPSYSHREFMEAVLRQAYRAMIEAASPTPQGEGRGE